MTVKECKHDVWTGQPAPVHTPRRLDRLRAASRTDARRPQRGALALMAPAPCRARDGLESSAMFATEAHIGESRDGGLVAKSAPLVVGENPLHCPSR